MLLRKTFTVDQITHRRLENTNEESQYYISNNHKAIISPEMYEETHKILANRSTKLFAKEWLKNKVLLFGYICIISML